LFGGLFKDVVTVTEISHGLKCLPSQQSGHSAGILKGHAAQP